MLYLLLMKKESKIGVLEDNIGGAVVALDDYITLDTLSIIFNASTSVVELDRN